MGQFKWEHVLVEDYGYPERWVQTWGMPDGGRKHRDGAVEAAGDTLCQVC